MKDSIHYALIKPENIESAWRIAAPWLMQAIGEVDLWADIDELKRDLCLGTTQLWVFQEKRQGEILVVIITETVLIAGKRCLVIRWLGGKEIKDWLDDIAIIERWAALQGYHKLEVWGRAGWQRALKPYGFRESFRVLEKIVDLGVH